MTVKVVVNKLGALESIIKSMTEKSVLVGIRGSSKRDEVKVGSIGNTGVTNSQIAYTDEFGSPARNIPPRPFLIPAVNEKKEEISEIFKKNFQVAVTNFDPKHIDDTFEAVGTYVRQTAKNNITNSVNMKPLSENTIERRREKGFHGTKPLIETGQLVGSIDYFVDGN